jgi:hypothetical protein
MEIAERTGPVIVRDLYVAMFNLILAALGVYWIIRNPKKNERPLCVDGDPSARRASRPPKIILAVVVLLAALLMIYQLLFVRPPP